MKFGFYAHSARLLRKLDHVFLLILSNNTGMSTVTGAVLKKAKKISMASNVLPLHFTKNQMSTTSSLIVTILLKSLLKSLGLYKLKKNVSKN
jgi:hypothetical protein